ncbi:MAG: hypothetical protein QOI31_732 [Solirubrobacterales bacterium]|nr:hypothetical protein [Solirubrobacterales bacterium]
MNPLLAPFEITVGLGQRVMRDLDAMSEVARSVPRVITLLESLDKRAGQVLELGERIDARAESMLELGQNLDRRAEAILTLGGRIDERAEELGAIGSQMLTEAQLVQQRAAEVVAGANEMIAVLPTVRRAIEIGEPLEGAIERFARVVDRLPGASAPSRRADSNR